MSDNGPPFGSAEFEKFCEESDILLFHSPPYHPASNGLAERWVQTVKTQMRKMMRNQYSEQVLNKVVFGLRNSPAVDGMSPAQKIFSFVPRTKLEKLLPSSQFERGGEGSEVDLPVAREFTAGEQVFVKVPGKDRSLAVVVARTGKLTYEVNMDGVKRAAHANQMVRFRGEAHSGPVVPVEAPSFATGRPQRLRKPPARYTS